MLLDTLAKNGFLTKEQQAKLEKESSPFVLDKLISTGVLPSDKLAKIISRLFREPLHQIDNYDYQQEALKVHQDLAVKHQILPLKIDANEMLIAVSDPTCIEAQNDFRFYAQRRIKIALVEHKALKNAIAKTYGKALITNHQSQQKTLAKLNELADFEQSIEEELAIDEAPVSQYIHQVLQDAVSKKASDIHFEPFEKSYQVRFRLDGRLQLYSSPPAGIARRLSSRLKIIAKLNIAERRLPQDGRLKFTFNNKLAIDMRVSTLPTLWGEKIVLRILDSGSHSLGFNELNLTAQQQTLYLAALNKPQGMILVTGPTGSGKTVSLYTGLNYLNTQDRNISTAEDPVEINLAGINQVNINPDIGLSFATTLRALLRQDPDVLMLGEIRDLETAEIAVKAAQTGHMVLSTLHTNCAAQTITRLRNMGVAPYNLAASLNLIIAQRLVRKLCPRCKIQQANRQIYHGLKKTYPTLKLDAMFKANLDGCEYCNQGYLGRIGIFEFIHVNKEMAQAITKGTGATELAEIARQNGMQSMQQAGIEHVNLGLICIDELQRVLSL